MFQFVKVKDNVKSKLKKKDDVKSKLSFDHFEIFCKAKNLAKIGLKTGGDTFGQKWPIFVHKKTKNDIYTYTQKKNCSDIYLVGLYFGQVGELPQ